ncbi:hypothetical protein ACRALDRAFT_1069548, partial [Sodiomyces alcalophilus JCM 7366]|uniref:uncharacterized protein n=1 Tax=Sodiomyces alcalophilus JCM 7366 TaxID=591952 RepID=UPI0039B4D90D
FSTKDNEVLEFRNLSIVSSHTLEVLTDDQRRKVQSLMNSILGVLKKLIITLKNNSKLQSEFKDALSITKTKGLIASNDNRTKIPPCNDTRWNSVFRPYIFSVILDPRFNYSFLFRDANMGTFDLFAFKQQIYEDLEEEYNTLRKEIINK